MLGNTLDMPVRTKKASNEQVHSTDKKLDDQSSEVSSKTLQAVQLQQPTDLQPQLLEGLGDLVCRIDEIHNHSFYRGVLRA